MAESLASIFLNRVNRDNSNFREAKTYNDSMRKYHQLIYGIDVVLEMIRDDLNKLGIADNTVIIYTDNTYREPMVTVEKSYLSKKLPEHL